jgi:hypothetical protein
MSPYRGNPRLRAGVGLSHRTQLQRYKDGKGTQKTRGFARGAEDLLIPGSNWQVGVSNDSLLEYGRGYFSNVK